MQPDGSQILIRSMYVMITNRARWKAGVVVVLGAATRITSCVRLARICSYISMVQ